MKLRTLPTALILSAMLSPVAQARTCDAPKPNVSVAQPGAEVPETFRGFALALSGWWADELCHYVVVTDIATDGTVKAVYSWGSSELWGYKPKSMDTQGKIEKNVLVLDLARPAGDPVTATYAWTGSGFNGTFLRPEKRIKSTASMERIEWPPG